MPDNTTPPHYPNGDIRRLDVALQTLTTRFDDYMRIDTQWKTRTEERGEKETELLQRISQTIAVSNEKLSAACVQLAAQQACIVESDKRLHNAEVNAGRPLPLCAEHERKLQMMEVTFTERMAENRVQSAGIARTVAAIAAAIISGIIGLALALAQRVAFRALEGGG